VTRGDYLHTFGGLVPSSLVIVLFFDFLQIYRLLQLVAVSDRKELIRVVQDASGRVKSFEVTQPVLLVIADHRLSVTVFEVEHVVLQLINLLLLHTL